MTVIKINEKIEIYNPGTVPYKDTDEQYWPLVEFLHEIIPLIGQKALTPDISPNNMKLHSKDINPWVSIREIYRWGEKQGIQVTLYREDGGRGGGIRLKDEVIVELFGLSSDNIFLSIQAIRNGPSPRYLEFIGALPSNTADQAIEFFHKKFSQ